MMFIEADSSVIFRVDQKRKDCGIGASGALRRIHDERATELTALASLIDCKPANQRRRQGGITRQALDLVGS